MSNINDRSNIGSQRGSVEPAAYTLKQFSESYRIGMTSVFEEIKAGRLKTVKLGAKHLVPKGNADAWLHSLPSGNNSTSIAA